MQSIVAFSIAEPGQVLNVCASETLPCDREVLLDAQLVDGRPRSFGLERLPGELAADCMLQVEEAYGALDIGQRIEANQLDMNG